MTHHSKEAPGAPAVSPIADVDRLQRLASYRIADTAREPLFDGLLSEVARLTSAPVAILGFLQKDHEWVKASVGWNINSLPRAFSLAASQMGERDVVSISDLAADPRYAVHPLVKGSPFLRFLAAAPLVDPDGFFLGCISLVDRSPRVLTREQEDILRVFAGRVMSELRLRRHDEETLRLKASLDDANERFRDFFERTTDLIMSIDADGRLLHANQAVLDKLGLTREELVNLPLVGIIDPSVRNEFQIAYAEVIAAAEPQTIETMFVTASGRTVNVEGSVHPKVLDGRSVMARVMFRDISERIAFEGELGRARDAALESARLKQQFLTNVSHEIRTPMNGIVGMIDLLTSTHLNEEQQDFALQARVSAEQLLSIINNILYVSNLEAGGLTASAADFDLYRMLQRIVEVMKIGALGKDLDVTFTFDERLPAVFRGNQAKLRQVIGNLMENAVKFTEQGKVSLRVTQQTETDTHRVVRFEVSDTGIGVVEEDRLLLFEKFSQVEAGSTRRFGGVGLGLATARHLVEAMGGLIDLDSVPGSGSTFWFMISFPKQAAGRPIASSDLTFKGTRVLLVDSVLTSRKIVRHYLENSWEMRVDATGTAAEALAMLRRAAVSDPYRVLVYERMSELDEISFAKEVRGNPRIAGTHLVVMIPSGAEVNEERMREAGIQAYVAKPVGQSELFDAMTIALAREALPLPRSAMAAQSRSTVPPPVPMEERASVRVLLVEDNFLNMKLTMSQLQRLGYQAESVSNGREALEAVARGDHQIIVMDCQMPVMDGYEATMELRKRDGAKHRRIIAMTANALEGDREKCLAAGMDDYLSKPTRQEDLEAALGRYFQDRERS